MPRVSREWNSAISLETITQYGLSNAYDNITISDEAILHLMIELKLERWVHEHHEAEANVGGQVGRRIAGRRANRVEVTSTRGQERYLELFVRIRDLRTHQRHGAWKDAILDSALNMVAVRNNNRQPGARRRVRAGIPAVRLLHG
jgi:hypothetical protein